MNITVGLIVVDNPLESVTFTVTSLVPEPLKVGQESAVLVTEVTVLVTLLKVNSYFEIDAEFCGSAAVFTFALNVLKF